jgi:hypothetical protein
MNIRRGGSAPAMRTPRITLTVAAAVAVVAALVAPRSAAEYARARTNAPWAKNGGPTVRGVGLGTDLGKVQRQLGTAPHSWFEPHGDDVMGMGDSKTLEYGGLHLGLCRPGESRDFHVWEIIVTEPRWDLSPGVRIGMTRAETTALLGQPEAGGIEIDGDVTKLFYTLENGSNWLWVAIRDDKVTEFGWSEDWS